MTTLTHMEDYVTRRKQEGKILARARKATYARQWRVDNPDYARPRTDEQKLADKDRYKRYRQQKGDELRAKERAYHHKNRDVRNAQTKAYRVKNRMAMTVYFLNYHRKNKDRIAEYMTAYRNGHRDKMRAYVASRRARERGAEGGYTKEDVLRLYSKQKRKCAYCKAPLKNKYHVDHINPLILGGTNNPKNLQLLCPPCNRKKGGKHPITFAQSLGLLL